MKPLEDCVLASMDGTDKELFQFLPYIFRDIWELGASPEVIIDLIKKHFNNYSNLKLLDLGCGKGAVSIKTAKALGCKCFGIDAIDEFINEAKRRAIENNVNHRCIFETGDIRTRISEFREFDVVVIGAVGNVFGNYYTTLKEISKCVKPDGKIIIDDAYVEDRTSFTHQNIESRSSIIAQSKKAGMRLIDESITDKQEIEQTENYIFQKLKLRCEELMIQYPEQKNLFLDYIKSQSDEGEVIITKVICSTMVFGKEILLNKFGTTTS